MIAELRPAEIDHGEASAWLEKSLREGLSLSRAVLASQIVKDGRFLILVPSDFNRSPLDLGAGGVIPLNTSSQALGEFFDGVIPSGAGSVVVEDDMRRASDPGLSKTTEAVAFIGERVIHWCDLAEGGQACAQAVKMGSHWYPLNAFVSTSCPHELGLVNRQEAPKELPQWIASSLVAVVVAAFDSESFLIWTREPRQRASRVG
jgi:hypothetical protein